ncbi:MAG TPA: lysylphosphatidylglycerol synthase transmembrane domain-containing protein [Phycisphaeraceae bacterium]
MKKHLARIARLILAAAGVAYIALSLTWTDQVLLPAGTPLPDGTTLAQPQAARVISRPSPGQAGGVWTVQLTKEADGSQPVLTLPDTALDTGDEAAPHYQPGIVSTLAQADVGLLIAGLLLVGLVTPLQAWRWLMLMRCRGLDPGYLKSLRLNLVGLFFNFCMPGMTGGDLIKAYYAAKGSGRRGAAVMSVIFDRLTGMVALILLAALMGLALLGRPMVWKVTLLSWLALVVAMAGMLAYFSHRLRRWLGVPRLLERLSPQSWLVRIDQAALAYRDHRPAVYGAVLISLPGHLIQMIAAALAGWALGMDLPLTLLVTVLPLVFFVGAMPITPQGIGVMEALALALLLEPPAATANQIVGMLLVARLYFVLYAVLGSLLLLRGDIHLFPQEADPQPLEADEAAQPARV